MQRGWLNLATIGKRKKIAKGCEMMFIEALKPPDKIFCRCDEMI
jgi:hypothetical protein